MTVAFLSCEKVVIIELPEAQNLLVVEGWITNFDERQYIRLTRSNSFSDRENPPIDDALVRVEVKNSGVIDYVYTENGTYLSTGSFSGAKDNEYRAIIIMSNGDLIRSEWTKMSAQTKIVLISPVSFEENDPDNPGQTTTIYYPRITALDSANFENFYRWVFFRNGERLSEPESITLQRDIFFDGNFIPNSFDRFEYDPGDEMEVQLHSIEERTHDYLSLLKSQITTLGGAASTTPAIVSGNLTNLTNPDVVVLGYFGTTAISSGSEIAQ